MLTVRCTRRLLTRLRATPSSEASMPTTRLGDWYAGIVPFRKPLAIFMSERTLLVVLVPLAPSVSLLARWKAQLRELLERLDVPSSAIEDEIAACDPIVLATTANRRVLGCVNEAVQILRLLRVADDGPALREHEDRLAGTIYSTTGYQRPADLLREVFGLTRRMRRRDIN